MKFFLVMDAENPISPEFSRILHITKFLAFSIIICKIKNIKNHSVILALESRVLLIGARCSTTDQEQSVNLNHVLSCKIKMSLI